MLDPYWLLLPYVVREMLMLLPLESTSFDVSIGGISWTTCRCLGPWQCRPELAWVKGPLMVMVLDQWPSMATVWTLNHVFIWRPRHVLS